VDARAKSIAVLTNGKGGRGPADVGGDVRVARRGVELGLGPGDRIGGFGEPTSLHPRTAVVGTGPKSSALQRFRPVTEALTPSRSGSAHACS
jgi:hypothetical protein